MAKFCHKFSRIRIRIQRDVYFMSGNKQRKYNKRNSWIEVSDETIPKPKLEKELNDLQSVPIFLSHPLFLNKEGQISEKWVEGQLILGVIFSFLAIIVTDTAFAF